jgi:mono/diheme cytochrome c family protein
VLTMLLLAGPALADAPVSPASQGREIYVAKCQACHGERGRGDGPAARALPKKPRDYTSPAYWASVDDEQVKRIITGGLPGTIMRGFPMPADQLDDLLAYLKAFAKDERPPG